jgi:hypothetical protein
MPLLARLHLEWRDPEAATDPETKELLMETRELYETWYQKTLAEGEARGRAEGKAQGELRALLTVHHRARRHRDEHRSALRLKIAASTFSYSALRGAKRNTCRTRHTVKIVY